MIMIDHDSMIDHHLIIDHDLMIGHDLIINHDLMIGLDFMIDDWPPPGEAFIWASVKAEASDHGSSWRPGDCLHPSYQVGHA